MRRADGSPLRMSCKLGAMGWRAPKFWRDPTWVEARDTVFAAALLLSLGILLQRVFVSGEQAVPMQIYWEASYGIAFLEQIPFPLALCTGLGIAALATWIVARPAQTGWQIMGLQSGLRWVVFGIAISFTWSYAGHGLNHYFGQAHPFERVLLLLSALMILRSPLWLFVFMGQLLLSRAQIYHPAALSTPITDELPLRILCILSVFLALGFLLRGIQNFEPLRALRSKIPLRLDTVSLILAILCLLGVYYSYAGLSKLLIGESALDWSLNFHLENFFVASTLNGWLPFLSEPRALAIADWLRVLSAPLGLGVVILELGMLFIALRLRGSVLLLLGVIGFHLGVALLHGVLFWKWIVADALLAGWLWANREGAELRGLYARPVACGSVLLILLGVTLFAENKFSWWNSKWNLVLEVEARGASGSVYDVDYSDFSPYFLYAFLRPYPGIPGGDYGTMNERDRMQDFEVADLSTIERDARERGEISKGPGQRRRERIFADFARRYFSHRNHNPGVEAIPFLPSAPRLRVRFPRGDLVYHDQEPVVAVDVRLVESYYTGASIITLRDEPILSVAIPEQRMRAPTRIGFRPGSAGGE